MMRPSTADVRVRDQRDEEVGVGCSLAEFKVLGELGKGAYGTVYRVLSLRDGKEYVLKKIPVKHLKKTEIQDVIKEAKILRKVDNQFIVKSFSHFVEGGALNIVMEYAEGGDLQKYIKTAKKNNTSISEETIWRIAEELAQALLYLHDHRIIHRDVKTLNVFLTKEFKVKLGDLGVSKVVNNALAAQNTRVGTPLYLSPELVKQKPYDFKIDVWAMGCILYQMCNGKAPFSGENLISLGYSIVHNQPTPISSSFSTELSEFIMKLLEKSPTRRPSSAEVCSLIQQYRRQTKASSLGSKAASTVRLAVHDPDTKAKLLSHNPTVKVFPEEKNIIEYPLEPKESPRVPVEEEKIERSPRKVKLSQALGKTDIKNVGLMSHQFKKSYSKNPSGERETDSRARLALSTHDAGPKGTPKNQPMAVSYVQERVQDLEVKENNISRNPSFARIENKGQIQSSSRISASRKDDIDSSANRLDKVQPRNSQGNTQEIAEKPASIERPIQSAANFKPARNIQSAYGGREGRPSSSKLIVNPRKLPTRVQCVEMMLQRAILKDPVHNMIKHGIAEGLQGTNPYSPPISIRKEKKKDLFKAPYFEKETATDRKPEKITIGSMPTSAMEYNEKAKTATYDERNPKEEPDFLRQAVHPFLDPFRKLVHTPGASKGDIDYSKRQEDEIKVAHVQPKKENFRAKIRPQTANPNLNSRPCSAFSGISAAQQIPGRSKDLDTSNSMTEKRNYRIKTATVGTKKDSMITTNVGPKSTSEFKERKVTIHDL